MEETPQTKPKLTSLILIITFSFCHTTLRDHMINRISDFVSGSLSTQVTAVLTFMLVGLVEVDTFLIYHMTSRDDIIKRLSNFLSGSPSVYVTTLPSLTLIDLVEVEINVFIL